MPILELRSQCSEVLFAQVEALRGEIPRDEFLMQALSIGIGHLQEEVLNQQRQRAYDRLAMGTNSYHRALDLHKLERPPASGVGVAPFGQDVTRPKAAP
jgi:hypothetical protein